MVNAIVYVLRSGGVWRLSPHDFPPWQTVYRYFRAWLTAGIWERIHTTLRENYARKWGAMPSASTLDSQLVKITCHKEFRGYDGAKKANGRKRQPLVDTQGLGAEVLFERIQGQLVWISISLQTLPK